MILNMSKFKRVVALALIFLILFLESGTCIAASNNKDYSSKEQVVTVGYYYRDGFQEGNEDGVVKKGYSYEYLHKIASITGWRYKYVYGSWEKIYNKFVDGEIDLLAGIDYTESRAEQMNFPVHSMGDESYYIISKINNESVNIDLNSLNGKKIGSVRGALEKVLSDWLSQKKINAEIVSFSDATNCYEALENRTIDCVIDESVMLSDRKDLQAIAKVADSEMYLCTAKNRTDLLEELNNAQDQLNAEDPYFKNSLIQKYYSFSTMIRSLTLEEKKWVEDNPEIVVGYFSNYMPFCEEDKNGKPTGMLVDLLPEILKNVGLEKQITIKYKSFNNSSEMVEALRDGKINLAFPVTDNTFFMEKSDLFASRSVINTDMEMVFDGDFNENTTSKIAVNKNNLYQINYARVNYPKSKLIYKNSIEECLVAVFNHDATCTVINSYRTKEFLTDTSFENLSTMTLPVGSNRCFGVNRSNLVFLSILNRGIGALNQDYAVNTMLKYEKREVSYTFLEYMKTHLLETFVILISIAMVIVIFFGILLNKSKHQKIYDTMAHRDSMTRLLNRRAYEEKFTSLQKGPIPSNLVYVSMDINGLKVVNDTLGHDAGDELIKGVSSCFRSALKFYGDVYRTGGDEFIGIVCASPKEVEEMKLVLEGKINAWSGDVVEKAHISVGFVERREFPDYSIIEIAKEADKRMYDMKNKFYQHIRKKHQ